MELNLTINGKQKQVVLDGHERLSDVLRYRQGLTATKSGCDAGDCGACSVLIDDKLSCACLVAAGQLEGARVETLEGAHNDPLMVSLREQFLAHGAAQCGICTPGMLMSAVSLLRQNPKPTCTDVEDALGGVLCRCTGYAKIIDAVLAAGKAARKAQRPEAGKAVGTPIRHLDGEPKVNGSLKFGADTIPADALYIRLVTNPYHHADFTFTDKAAFLAQHDGIEAMFTAADIPGRNCHGVIPPFADQPVFAESTAKYKGEAVAAIVGKREAIAKLHDDELPVKWQPREHVLSTSGENARSVQIHPDRKDNILTEGLVRKGNAKAALSNAAYTAQVSTSTPFVEHAYIEPEAGFASIVDGRIVVVGSTQAAQMDRESLAEILDLPVVQIRVKPSACGGGFGSKLDISYQPYIALAAFKLNRSVAIIYSRGSSMRMTTKRHPSEISLKVGCDKTGKLQGFHFEGVFNTGAYASWGPTVANRVPVHASGPYFVKDYYAIGTAVHTNTPPAGAFRGFGVPQSAIAQECAFDDLAEQTGIDRLQFRLLNALKDGKPTATGQVMESGVGITACLETLKAPWQTALDWASRKNAEQNGGPYRYGVGIGTCWYGCGNTSLPNPSTVRFGLKGDGTFVLHQGAMDIGQGANTVITQIAADALGIPVHAIKLVDGDTDLTPDCGKTSASRQTYVTGTAARLAGETLRKTILRTANVGEDGQISVNAGSLEVSDATGSTQMTIDLQTLEPNDYGYVFMAEETYDPPTSPLDENGQGIPYAVYGYGAQIVTLRVDTKLGLIKLIKITTAHDLGRAINPLLVEGQIEGGVMQGAGMALMEEYLPGVTENLHDYLIPTIGDVPQFEHHLIEITDPEGPYGAKGLGEHVLIPTAPAILSAITHACGAKIRDLPATPARVRAAIRQQCGKV